MTQVHGHMVCELTVAGPVARSLIEVVRARFTFESTHTADATVLTVNCVDQAAVRALMVLLWDSGHQVVSMAFKPAG